MHKLVCIVGPTGIGKSALAVEMASLLEGEIISADSVQVYRGLDIGSGKITEEEMRASNGEYIPHHLLSFLAPDEKFSVAAFKSKVESLIPELIDTGKIPFLVGGTGLYIEAVIDPYRFPKLPRNEKLRQRLKNLAAKEGREFLHKELSLVDPVSAKKIHQNDLRRVIRALEVYYQTGTPISAVGSRSPGKNESKYDLIYIGLEGERVHIYERINKRVDQMMASGFVEEVMDLLKAGYDKNLPSLQSLGYRQIIDYLDGKHDLSQAIELIKRDTRRYAKRQLTWFKRDDRIIWYSVQKYASVMEMAQKIVQEVCRTSGWCVEKNNSK